MVMPVLVLFLCVNVGVLYYMVFTDLGEFERRLELMDQRLSSVIRREEVEPLPEVTEVPDEVVRLTDQQKDEVAELAVTAMEKKINKLVNEKVAATLAEDEEETTSVGGVKEYFVPFGQASVVTEDGNWKDTPQVVEIDMGNYTGVASVVFEATLRIPSGNGQVGVRLYNASDGYMVAGSELYGEGMEGQFKRSGNLSLAGGKKTYRVQMKTSMNYVGWMDMGRLKITLE